MRQIQPPESLRGAPSYLKPGLYVLPREMAKVAADGRDEHLIVAHERSGQASHALLQLSDVLWPGEYKPN